MSRNVGECRRGCTAAGVQIAKAEWNTAFGHKSFSLLHIKAHEPRLGAYMVDFYSIAVRLSVSASLKQQPPRGFGR